MNVDERDSYEEYLAQKRAYVKRRKKKKLKRFFAVVRLILVLGLMLCLLAGLVILAVKGVKKLVGDKNIFFESEYVKDVPSVELEEIINVFPTTPPETEDITASSTSDVKDEPVSHSIYGTIIVDAGHGGYDPGAINAYGNESDINLSIAMMVTEKLTDKGYNVYLTRTDNTFVGLTERASNANSQDMPLALVSIHQNICEDDESVCGIEALTYKRDGCAELAELLTFHTSEAVGVKNRGTQFKTNLVVTSKTTMPAVIIECGFMSNSEEAALLVTEDYQAKLSAGITNALIEFINSYY